MVLNGLDFLSDLLPRLGSYTENGEVYCLWLKSGFSRCRCKGVCICHRLSGRYDNARNTIF